MTRFELVWERELHHRASPRAVISASLIVVPERHSRLTRVDPATGEVIWSSRIDGPHGWLAVGEDCCVYLEQHQLLRAAALEDGRERWTMDLAGSTGSAGSTFGYVLVAGDQAIAGGWRGYTDVVGLSRHDGALTWTLPTRGRMLAAPVAAPDGTVLLTFPDENRAWVVDGASGEIVGETSGPAPRGRAD